MLGWGLEALSIKQNCVQFTRWERSKSGMIKSVLYSFFFWRIWYYALKFYKVNFFEPQWESDLIFLTAIISIDYPKGKHINFSQFSIICTTWEHQQEKSKIHEKITLSDCDHDLISWSKKNCSEEQFHKAVLLDSKQIKKSVSPGNYSAAMWVFISAQSAQSLDRVLLARVLVKRISVKTDKSGTKHIGGLVAVLSDSYDPMDPARLLCPWDFPGKNIGMGCHFLLQGSFHPRNWTQVSCTAGRFFTNWAIREFPYIFSIEKIMRNTDDPCINGQQCNTLKFSYLIPANIHSSRLWIWLKIIKK